MINEIKEYYSKCSLCPWNCQINRFTTQGKCLLRWDSKLSYKGIIYGEEIDISPTYGIYFAGCNLKCSFCLYKEFQDNPKLGKLLELIPLIDDIKNKRANYETISFIGGEPSIHLLPIIQIINSIKSLRKPSVVLNSNMYFSDQAKEILSEMVDIFIANFHFGNDLCAYKLSGALNYLNTVLNNIKWAIYKKKKIFIRHLLLPGHLYCCLEPILKHCSELEGVNFNLMLNYVPCNEACKNDKIDRKITKEEKEISLGLLEKYNMETIEQKEIKNYKGSDFIWETRGEEQEIIIDNEGYLIVKYLTKEMKIFLDEIKAEDNEIRKRAKLYLI